MIGCGGYLERLIGRYIADKCKLQRKTPQLLKLLESEHLSRDKHQYGSSQRQNYLLHKRKWIL